MTRIEQQIDRLIDAIERAGYGNDVVDVVKPLPANPTDDQVYEQLVDLRDFAAAYSIHV